MKAIAFSNYLIYNIGGAEPSLILLLDKTYPNCEKELLSFKKPTLYKTDPLQLNIPSHLKIGFVPRTSGIAFFPFIEYFFNRKKLANYFSNKDADYLIASSIYAPIAINHFQGKDKCIFIQSDIDLGKIANYETGIKKIIKYAYNLIQLPFLFIYKKDIKKALQNSQIVCNSHYTKSLVKKLYGIENCVVEHPMIDEIKLKKSYLEKKEEINKKGIVFIGNDPHKGLHIAIAISKTLKEYSFYFFSKKIKEPTAIDNITYIPWVNDAADAYKYAKMVIMPSQWNETFGRVGREAHLLNIPVLVSNCGGLPEAVFYDKNALVDDYKNVQSWIIKIKEKMP
jgi:glycosyltransferase involved in cell wall biosynthesis